MSLIFMGKELRIRRIKKMLELLFAVLMITIFGKMFIFGMKATWGITKIIFSLILLPIALIGLVIGGLVSLALPILLVIGVISMFCFD